MGGAELVVVESSVLVDLHRKSVSGDASVGLVSCHSDEASAAPSEVDCSGSDMHSVQGRASVQGSPRDCVPVHYSIHLTASRVWRIGPVAVPLKGYMAERLVFPLIGKMQWTDGRGAPGTAMPMAS